MAKAMMKGALPLVPLACLCLSANAVAKDKSIIIGPLLEDEAMRIQFRLYKANYQSTWTVFFDCTGSGIPSLPTGFDKCTIGDLREEGGYGYFSSYLPKAFLKGGSNIHVELGISKETYYRGIDGSKVPFVFRRDFSIKKGAHLFRISEDGIFETQNEVYHLDEARPSSEVFSHDSYDVRGLCMGADIGGRKVPLNSLYVDYFGFGASPLVDCSAELRLLNFQEDFEGIANNNGAYSTIPLSVSVAKTSSGDYRYHFALSEIYYYSRIDLRASKRIFRDEPYFQSNAFFLPLREGHDGGAYRFQIVLEKAGAYGETLILDNEAFSSRSYFGNCLDSEYCVIAGGE